MLSEGYSIRLAHREDIAALPDIERQASTRFKLYGFEKVMSEILTPLHWMEQCFDKQQVWVAVKEDKLVGFALADVVEPNAHLDELDVLPEHGRQGVGTALVETACEWGRAHGYKAITLSTLSNIPWNAPFYSRLGFRILAPDELSAAQQKALRDDAERGLPNEHRVMMIRDLQIR